MVEDCWVEKKTIVLQDTDENDENRPSSTTTDVSHKRKKIQFENDEHQISSTKTDLEIGTFPSIILIF